MNNEKLDYDAIGDASAAATLTAAYTGNTKTLDSKYLNTLHLDIEYTPKAGQTNRFIEIEVRGSNNEGTTFFGIGNKSDTTTKSLLYEDIPIKFPGDGVSTGGTAMTAQIDIPISHDKIKISVKEDGSANFGTVYIQAALKTGSSSNN